MAKTKRKAGKRATAAGRDGPRARKSGVPKTRKPGTRKPKATKPAPRKRKPSLPSETARLKKRLKTARMQQQASAEILRAVLNASGDAALPLQQIAEITARLFGAPSVSIQLAEGGEFTQEYRVGAIAQRIGSAYPRSNIRVGGPNMPGTVVFENRQIHIPDLDHLDPSMSDWPGLPHARAGGSRTLCGTPLRREGKAIGALMIFRDRLLPFTDDELVLQQSFAEQAVIAIENARLFNETRDALERQTATAEVLKVIASSPSDVQPVFDAIAASANRLLGGFSSTVFRFTDAMAHLKAFTPTTPEADEILQLSFPRPVADFAPFQMTQAGEVMQIPDTEAPTYELKEIARARGYRSMLYVPLMNKGVSIGFIAVTRVQSGTFAHHHVQLLQTFADQAVIAIENARLFNEVQERTRDLTESLEQQTATSEVLEVISASTGELKPVFQKMLENATNICEANFGHMFLRDGDDFRVAALRSKDSVYPEWLKLGAKLAVLDNPGGPLAQIVRTERIVHIADLASEASYAERNARMVALVEASGARTFLGVPMFKDDVMIGVIAIYRQEMCPFTEKQIALVSSFAAQAVIAIENARLLNELRMRTTELSQSLDDLRTAQDRLIQTEKLASLGQLTAGIAHEIKNPLNFVNNFSAVSAELTDELSDVLKPAELDKKIREEVDELTRLLKNNLEKVVQHGKRADSIVKNMLLHSREGSGEHRPADINSLLDESLNLAYHGARAEKGEFNITLRRDFDVDAGTIELFPQEITRAFLNLIANGVYAATKRKTEDKEPDFEPTIRATTKNLGTTVEIRIRDNGTGIPAEVQEKMFNPFFTTKPAGEGTGLGLSMTHDIVVKQHGGRIDFETEPGQFTEFTIVLPRKRNLSGSDRGRA
jgi:two-component system NtrC family sensor kinase